ncbi:cold-shock protein [Pseudomonas sp. SED1]|uniref:cold-shock protein n=1 Tax=Pseudomonas sp. SED1 TaxID=3056845 RepID=UPI0039906B70
MNKHRGNRDGIIMATGTAKLFNDADGSGIITPDNGGEDLFAHFKNIQGDGFWTLHEG